MSTIRKTLRACLGAAVTASALLSQAFAGPLVYIDPASTTVPQGGADFTVGIWVSGLTEPTGGFSGTLSWDSSLLTGASFTVDPTGGMGTALDAFNDASLGFTLGSLDLFFIADPSKNAADLTAAEMPGPFELATVTFTPSAAKSGTTPLTLSNVVLSNADGNATLADTTTRNGSVCVADPAGAACGGGGNVPEPASFGLAGLALLAAGWAGRRRLRSHGSAAAA